MTKAGEGGDRLPALDCLRGAGTLAAIPIAARWLLHPRAHLLDPTLVEQTTASMAWWHLTEVFCDETWLWLIAGAFGAALAAARAGDDSQGWRRTHYTRMGILVAVGLAWNVLVWPGDILLLLGLTGLMITGAVDDIKCEPLKVGLAAGAGAILASLALSDGQGLLLMSSRLPHEAATLGSADYNAWETRMYIGEWSASIRVRWEQTTELWSRVYPARALWQCGSAMLLGIWWYRRGRHQRWRRRATAGLIGTGLLYTTVATLRSAGSGYDELVVTVLQNGTYAGGAFITAGLFIWTARTPEARWTSGIRCWLATAGRHSLTLYVTATLVLSALAHGWGLGLHGSTTGDQQIAIVLAVLGLTGGMTTISQHHGDSNGIERSLRTLTRIVAGRRKRRPPRRPKTDAGT